MDEGRKEAVLIIEHDAPAETSHDMQLCGEDGVRINADKLLLEPFGMCWKIISLSFPISLKPRFCAEFAKFNTYRADVAEKKSRRLSVPQEGHVFFSWLF